MFNDGLVCTTSDIKELEELSWRSFKMGAIRERWRGLTSEWIHVCCYCYFCAYCKYLIEKKKKNQLADAFPGQSHIGGRPLRTCNILPPFSV